MTQRQLTRDQQRAQFAWDKVEEAAQQKIINDYSNLSKAVPSLIMNSGLMQTLAFLQAKMDPKKPVSQQHHVLLLAHVMIWLGPILLVPISRPPTTHEEIATAYKETMRSLHGSESTRYMRATSETMALLRWIRQFADARKAMEGR